MKHVSEKVVIVGAGNVGSMTAYTLLNQGLCKEIVLLDRDMSKAEGEAFDMQHASHFMNRRIHVKAGDYSECKNADIVIITASAPMNKNVSDRLSFLSSSKAIMKSIISSIMENGFSGILIIISNPVDIMTYYAWKISGLDKNHVIGTGTTLDSIRLEYAIGDLLHVDSKSVSALIIGEHGATSVPVFSSASVGGKRFVDIVEEDKEKLQGKTKEDLVKETIQSGFEIVRRKGNTSYGIASSVASIVKAIFFDEHRILPVTTLFEGQYGIHDVMMSMPCVLGEDGILEQVEIKLSEEEENALKNSAESIKKYYPSLED